MILTRNPEHFFNYTVLSSYKEQSGIIEVMFSFCRANELRVLWGWGGHIFFVPGPCIRCPRYGIVIGNWWYAYCMVFFLNLLDLDTVRVSKIVFTGNEQKLLCPKFFPVRIEHIRNSTHTIMRDQNFPLKPRMVRCSHFSVGCSSFRKENPTQEFNRR